MASTIEEGIRTLLDAIQGLQNARWTSAAATTVYLYDILITLDLEVDHIWSRLSFDFPTVLYIINRYICVGTFLVATYDIAGFHGPFTDDECRSPREIVGMMLAHTSWTGIMTIRVCALWRQKRMLVRLVWFIWACTMASIIATGYIAYKEVIVTMTYNPYIRICAPELNTRVLAITPIPPAIYELFLTTLTIVKAFDFGSFPASSTIPTLYRILARDGVAYFIMSTMISIGNMISWLCLPSSQLYLFLYLYWALLSVFIARLVLNLRAVYSDSIRERSDIDGVSADITFHTRTKSGIRDHGSRFINGEGSLGVDTLHPGKFSGVEEEEAWNVQVFHASQLTPPLPMKALETPKVDSDGADTAVPVRETPPPHEDHHRLSIARTRPSEELDQL